MSPTIFNDWSASVTSLGVAILWQSTFLVGLVAAACWLLRRSAPALRYWCWQIVALKLLLMPWWIVAVPLPAFFAECATGISPRKTVATENHQNAPGAAIDPLLAPPAEADGFAARKTLSLFDLHGQLTWHSWLVLAWLAGMTWQVGHLVIQRGRLRRLLSRATPASDPRLIASIENVAVRLGLSRPPEVVLTEGLGAPFVCGLFRPVLALPRELVEELDTVQLRDVLLHEVSHLRRRDLWWGWLPALARIMYFYHPVAHWVSFRIRLERELACDQLAMTLGGRSAAEYAEVLLQVVSRASMPAVLATSSLEGLSTFWRRRIEMLVTIRRSSPQLSRGACLGIASAALMTCLLPTFQHSPARAQGPNDAKSDGRIYVSASYRIKPEGATEENTVYNVIVAVDPASGDWKKIAENGNAARLSPDGRTMVFNRVNDGIWKCEADGQSTVKIFDQDGRPVWSPDGTHLVVTKEEDLDKENDKSRTTPAWKCETWQIGADGGNPIKMPIPETSWVEDWSPDRQWFVVGTDRHPPYGSGYQLYLMKTDGTQERRLTQGGLNVYARFSPDGKKILYVHQTRAEGNSIWTVDVDGDNAREIVKEVGLASPDGAFWSPDGKQIAVIVFDWDLNEDGEKIRRISGDNNFRIEVMDADGTNRRQIVPQGVKFQRINSLGDWR